MGKNVLMLVLDSLRKDRTSVYNDDIEFTPELERIAEESEVYMNAVAQAPWTLPSHASMFTGEYPHQHGAGQSKTFFRYDGENLVEKFKKEGYQTGAVTSNVWMTPHKGMTDEFDFTENFLGVSGRKPSVWLSRLGTKLFDIMPESLKKPVERYIDRVFDAAGIDDSCKSRETIEETKDFISRNQDRDFFLYTNIMEPHEPYNPPQKYLRAHGIEDLENIPERQKDLFTQDVDFDKLERVYEASVDYTDDLVKEVLDHLEDEDVLDDTVVVVLSDHGQALGENGIFGHQFTVDPAVTDIFMTVRSPEEEKTDDHDEMFELKEIYNLLPQLAGFQEGRVSSTEVAKGRYQFPTCFIGYVPKTEWDRYYRKYQYLSTKDGYAVRCVDHEGNEEYRGLDGLEMDPVKAKRDLREMDDENTENTEEASKKDLAEDDEIKKRLEDLGYK